MSVTTAENTKMKATRDIWAFRLAPLSSVIVWGGSVAAGNVGWLSGMFTDSPVSFTFVMTAITSILYLLSFPILKRLYAYWRRKNVSVGIRLFLCGIIFGGVWGWICSMIAKSYLLFGPACGIVVGLFLAVTLGRRRGEAP